MQNGLNVLSHKQPESARLICWNCASFRIAHTTSPTYPLQCLKCEAKGSCSDFLGNVQHANIVNRRRSA
jgi:hypothetical protein